MNKIKLFCFPYAGGSAMVYNKWRQFLHPDIELKPIELSGRGGRVHEPLYKDLKELANDVFDKVFSEVNNSPYAFFGHSLGALIAYKLVDKLKACNLLSPEHIFFSGHSAPHVKDEKEIIYHRLDRDDFKREVINLGGTPPEFFEHPELAELFLPLLKNDFKMAETYEFMGQVERFDGYITVFLGKEDDQTAEQCDGWKNYTSKLCKMFYFNGGHFFLHDETQRIVKIINETLSEEIYSQQMNI